MDPASEQPAGVAFGRFQVLLDRRELLADSRSIKLGGRAFDVLMALLEARGAVVSKDSLMARVWPGRVVEENSLAAQIVALRAAFGAERGLIRTVSGRGYQFAGEIRILSPRPQKTGAEVATAEPGSVAPPTNVPEPVSELIGRDHELREILNLAAAHRLVTLTGAGGIGKTTLALDVARELRPHFADGVWLAEFSALADPWLVPATVAAAVGIELGGGEASAQRVAQALAGRGLLLVLDTCEHVIDDAAALAEAVLGAGSALHIIATSREPLRAGGEWVYPVPPLALPAADDTDDDDPLRYGAVRLFVERARAAELHFAPDRRHMATIVSICRRLDGIPLAIELAAARAAALGVEQVAARLADRFHLLTGGRRTALPRHKTLRATLDWSHELLSETERVLLRRLSVFAGPFSLRATGAVAADAELAPAQILDDLSNLVAKSLVTTVTDGSVTRYRLLDMTRAYALETLSTSGERETLARRHAEYYREIFERAEAEAATRPTDEWLADYAPRMDNLRATLDWAFSPDGDISIGAALTAAAVSVWMQLSLMEECRSRVERALAAIAADANRDARCEMRLQAALAVSLMYTRGAVPEIGTAGTKALEIAKSLGDAEYQLRSLWGLWSFHTGSGRHDVALTVARDFHTLTAMRSEPNEGLIGDRIIGTSQYYLGDFLSARRHLEHVVARYVAPVQKSQIFRFEVDQWAAAQVALARVLWLQGLPEQAMRTAESSVAAARTTNHAMSLGQALALAACPIALFTGDLSAAGHYAEMLVDHSTRHTLARWRAWGLCHQGVLAVRRGDFSNGLRLLRAGFDEPGAAGTVPEFFTFLMADALGRAGQLAEAVATIEEAIDRSERGGERCAIAEMLRIKGELFLLPGARGVAAVAEGCFRQALDWARRQGALSWELRAATSLARLWRDRGRPAAAKSLLQPIYDRFTEGFETADLISAKALLDDLG
jgi:predicted ATPase/DNA-binding winged helix-turn-helix (wHTH) protein